MFLETNGYVSDLCDKNLTITAAAENIEVIRIVPKDLTVNFTCFYEFVLSPDDVIPAGSLLVITLPNEISVPDMNLYPIMNPVNLSSSANYSVVSNKIIITGGFLYSTNASFSFFIPNITNPASTKPTSAFKIQIFSYSSLLFQDSAYTITALPQSLQSINIALDSYATGDITTYNITTYGNLNKRQSLLINLPLSITKSWATSCIPYQGFSINDECIFTNQSITLATSDYIKGFMSVSVNNIKNPINTQPCIIEIYTITADGFIIAKGSFDLIMIPHSFRSIVINSDSYTVGVVSNYSLNISTYNPLPFTAYLSINTTIDLSFSYCDSLFVCEFVSGLFLINLTNPSSVINFKIYNVTNPISLNPAVFSIKSKDSYEYDASDISFAMTIPGAIKNLSVSMNSTLINQPVLISLSFIPTNYLSSSDPVVIRLPYFSNIKSKYSSIGSNITAFIFPQTNLAFTAITPTVANLYTIFIQTEKNGYIVDFGSLDLLINCTWPCSNCSLISTLCTECQKPLPYLYDNTCVDTCDTLLINGTCYDCESNCVTCSGSFNNCTKCKTGYILYKNICVFNCPLGTMAYADTCIECSNHCKTCSKSPVVCDSCVDGSYLNNGVCINNCTKGFYYSEESCLACSNICLSCTNTSNYCLECNTGLSYLGTCVNQCPIAQSIQINNTCEPCISSCSTCEFSIFNCTSCDSTKVLFESTCLSACPDKFYYSNGLCLKCQENCDICNSTECTACSLNFFLYKGVCVSACPLGTFEFVNQCKECNQNCSDCVSSFNCTDCNTDYLLYNNECTTSCPNGFINITNSCEKLFCGLNCTENMYNNTVCDSDCNNIDCNFDNFTCVYYSEELQISSEPMSFTTVAVGAGTVTGLAATVSAVSFWPAMVGTSGVLE